MATSAKRDSRRDAAAVRPAPADGLAYGKLDDLLGYHLRKAQQVAFQSFAETLADENISPGQLGVLLVVAANPGVNQTSVGNAMGIDRSTLVAVLDRLEERELLARTPSPTDRRSHALVLTARGGRFLDAVLPRIEQHEREFARALSKEERRTLIELLARIAGP